MLRAGGWIAVTLLALACGGGNGGSSDDARDAQPDAIGEVAPDTTRETGDDVLGEVDAPGDAPADTPADAPTDTPADGADTTTPVLASATQVPEGAIQGPALSVALVGTDDAARTITVEVALDGPAQVAGVAFDLAYDAAFLSPVSAEAHAPFSGGGGANPKALGAFVPERSIYAYGAALLRSSPVTIQETYYEKGLFPMPDQPVSGRQVLATLTFGVTAGGSGTLRHEAGGSVVKDRLFRPIAVSRYGLALVAK